MRRENEKIKLDKERVKRYKEKLEYLNKINDNFEKWTKNINEDDFVSKLNLKDQFSIYHAFQIMSELLADLAAMMVKDLKIIPKNDYANIEALKEKKIINEKLSINLKKVNGIRNRIVHNYNDIDEKLAYRDIKLYHNDIKNFFEVINKWLKLRS